MVISSSKIIRGTYIHIHKEAAVLVFAHTSFTTKDREPYTGHGFRCPEHTKSESSSILLKSANVSWSQLIPEVKSLSRVRLFATPWTEEPTGLLRPWDSPGKNTGVGCHFLLQGIFPTQGLNPGVPHCRQTL